MLTVRKALPANLHNSLTASQLRTMLRQYIFTQKIKRIALWLLCSPAALPLHADTPQQTQAQTHSGYAPSNSMEGPSGVASQIAEGDINTGAVLTPPILRGFFQPWYAQKKEWNQKYGLQLQFSYQALYQKASETLTGNDEAAAGRIQAQGLWTLLGRHSENPGQFSFRVEERHAIDSDNTFPTQLGAQFGSANLTGTGFSDFGLAVTEVAWRQTLLDGRMKFGLGKISAVSWYNAHNLSSSLTGFQNSALQASATKPQVGRGLGAVAGYQFNEQFVWIGGVHDANAVTADNPFDTIDEKEFYYSTEFRWYPTSWDRRRWDQVRLQLWYVDETDGGQTPSGYGAAFTYSHLYNDWIMPFATAGITDGSDASRIQTDATVGIAFALNTVHRAARDVLAIGVNWGNPTNSSLDDQITAEVFYRFQLFQNLAFTPSVQYIENPSYSPEDTSAWVTGIRARLTF